MYRAKKYFEEPPKISIIKKFLWWCAGADYKLLRNCSYNDHVKFFGLGGIVLTTGLMASLAGGYAFYTIFSPKGAALDTMTTSVSTTILSVVFGIIWGLIIFNIDRFIVTSTGKGDGTEKITKEEFKGAIPRIIMGIIIAITISKPVEIRMFQSEIDIKIQEKQLEQEAEYKKRIENNYKPFVLEAESKIKDLEKEVIEKTAQRDAKATELEKEIQGNIGSGVKGDGPASDAIRKSLDRIQTELDATKKRNSAEEAKLQKTANDWQKKIDDEMARTETVSNGLDGLLERIKISHEIAGWTITIFIMLLFLALELTPIFFKLMLIKSPYDYLEENLKEEIKARAGIREYYEFVKNSKGEIITEKNSKGREEEKVVLVTENLLAKQILTDKEKLVAAQRELSEYIINQWKEREQAKIDANLDSYLTQEDLLPEK